MKQVRCAALWLSDDVEIRQAAQAKLLVASVVQMLVEVCLEVITQGFEALRAQSKEVPLVRVGDEPTGKLLIPARALDARQEPARNYREQLRREARHSQISKKKNKDHSVD